MLKDKEEKQIKNYFNKQADVVAVYLYGSQSTGKATKDSDIDLAVLFDEQNKLSSSWGGRHVNIGVDLSKIVQKEVDVQDLSLADIDFCHRVLSEGKLVYSKKERQRTAFEVDCLNKYFDLKPLYEEYFSVLQQRARQGVI